MGVFTLSNFLFTRSLNFRLGGRGLSVPSLQRGGGARGNLSLRIKSPSAEEVQACSYPVCRTSESNRLQPAASGRSQVANIPLAVGRERALDPTLVDVWKFVESG